MQKSILYLSLFCATNAIAAWQHPQFTELNDSVEKQLFQGQVNFKTMANASNHKRP